MPAATARGAWTPRASPRAAGSIAAPAWLTAPGATQMDDQASPALLEGLQRLASDGRQRRQRALLQQVGAQQPALGGRQRRLQLGQVMAEVESRAGLGGAWTVRPRHGGSPGGLA
jgi:hypothetical protein